MPNSISNRRADYLPVPASQAGVRSYAKQSSQPKAIKAGVLTLRQLSILALFAWDI